MTSDCHALHPLPAREQQQSLWVEAAHCDLQTSSPDVLAKPPPPCVEPHGPIQSLVWNS
jgi:hypothetical protein